MKCKELPEFLRACVHRYRLHDGLLLFSTNQDDVSRIVVPNDDLKHKILFEYHDASISGHQGREKTYASLARDFYWHNQYKWVRKYVRTREICQRIKPAHSA